MKVKLSLANKRELAMQKQIDHLKMRCDEDLIIARRDLQDAKAQIESVIKDGQRALRDAEAHYELRFQQKLEEAEVKMVEKKRAMAEIQMNIITNAKDKAANTVK